MNNTNRALNRISILLTGLVLLALGAAAIGIAVVPAWASVWKDSASTMEKATTSALADTTFDPTGKSWILILVSAIALLLIILLLVFIFRQGHGRTRELLTAHGSGSAGSGTLAVDAAVAEQAIGAALADKNELLSASVSTFRIRGRAAIKVTVTPRRGVSPRFVQELTERAVLAWDTILGRDVPTLIHIHSGIRTRTAQPSRTQ